MQVINKYAVCAFLCAFACGYSLQSKREFYDLHMQQMMKENREREQERAKEWWRVILK